MKFLLLAAFSVICIESIAQTSDTIFYDAGGKIATNRDSAFIYWVDNNQKDTVTFYYMDGHIRQQSQNTSNKPDQKNGKAIMYYKYKSEYYIGEEGTYKNDQRDGKWTYYKMNEFGYNKSSEGSFVNGLAEGKWTYYGMNEFGYYKSSEGSFVNGLADGKCAYYIMNELGYYKEGDASYKKGLLDGKCIYYDINGTLIRTGEFKDNLRNGNCTYYDISDKVALIVNYRNDTLLRRVYLLDDKIVRDVDETDEKLAKEYQDPVEPSNFDYREHMVDFVMNYSVEIKNPDKIRVYVCFNVSKEGKVSEVSALKVQDPVLTKAAEDYVKTFDNLIPATRNGVPISTRVCFDYFIMSRN